MGVFVRRNRTRVGSFAIISLLTLFLFAFVLPNGQPAHAQEADAGGEAAQQKAPASSNFLSHIIRSAGPVFGPLILVISICLVALIVLLAMDLRMAVAIPPEFVDEFTDTVNKRRFKEAFEQAKADNSFLAKVLTAAMGRLQYGLEDARDVLVNTVDSIKANKDQLITYLATVGTLGPLIGLVGTVYGMIMSFMELSYGGTPRADKLADGISHALVVTLLGVALSVPAIFCHAFFRNRLIRISMDVSTIADDLLTQMYHNSRKPAAPSPAVNAAAAGAGAVAVKPAQG